MPPVIEPVTVRVLPGCAPMVLAAVPARVIVPFQASPPKAPSRAATELLKPGPLRVSALVAAMETLLKRTRLAPEATLTPPPVLEPIVPPSTPKMPAEIVVAPV